MNTQLYILFTLLAPDGPLHIAKFFLGDNRKYAEQLFSRLKSVDIEEPASVLQVELMELQKGLPVNLKLKSCTLDQLGENCKLLTCEAFKRVGLSAR